MALVYMRTLDVATQTTNQGGSWLRMEIEQAQ